MKAINLENDNFELNNLFTPLLSIVPETTKLKVHDIMSEEQIKIYEDDQVENVLRIMDWEGLKHVCVFCEDKQLAGILNYSNINKFKDRKKKVSELMHTDYHKIDGMLDADIGKVAVAKEPDHCMPVFENEEVVGILNLEDVFTSADFN